MNSKIDAERAIHQIALREGITVESVKNEMQCAIQAGFSSDDSNIRAYWQRIPSKGEVPTPEELITYIASYIGSR